MSEGVKWRILTPDESAEQARLDTLHGDDWRKPPPLRCFCGRFISSKTLKHSRSYFGEYLVTWDCDICDIYPDEPPPHWFGY